MPSPQESAPGNSRKTGKWIQQALAHHRLGQLADAERLYQGVLDTEPDHGEALRLLGMLRSQQGEGAQAIALISRALQDRKSTRLNSSHIPLSRMPSSA